ncbi:MAG: hypothetical protein N2257_02815 [Thermodesulfovibrionales bacterium]|nr:hypothetical protein [Thermodesulfovibrionales bacterium]
MKLSVVFCYLFYLFFISSLLHGCGKKGEPSYKKFIIPEPVSEINYLIRPDGIRINWNYHSREGVYFEIFKKSQGSFIKIGQTREHSFTDSSPYTGEAVEYLIVTVSVDGYRKEGKLLIPSISLPDYPASFNFRIIDDGIVLSWNLSAECHYNLYKVEDGREEILNKEPIKDSYFKDTPEPNMIRTYRLRCKRDSVEGFAAEVTVRPEDYIPSKPEGLRFVLSDKKVMLTWKENPEKWIKGYRIYRSYGESFTPVGEAAYPLYVDEPGDFKEVIYRITAVGPSREGPFSETIIIRR